MGEETLVLMFIFACYAVYSPNESGEFFMHKYSGDKGEKKDDNSINNSNRNQKLLKLKYITHKKSPISIQPIRDASEDALASGERHLHKSAEDNNENNSHYE